MADVITRFKVESSEYEKKIKSAKGQMSDFEKGVGQLSNSLGVNTKALCAVGVAIGTVTGALKVAKDAFFASEANIDEWGRTVESAKSLYEGFLTSLNTGDISGYLSRIGEIVSAAREAYNELDRLSTQKAINNKKVQAQMTENQRMQTMLRTGRYIAPLDGRTNAAGLKTGDKLTAQQLANISKNLESGMAKTRSFIEDDIHQTTKSIEALYKKEATNLGMTQEQFKAGTADMQSFDKVVAGYTQYSKWQKAYEREAARANSGQNIANPQYLGKANPFEQYKAWGTFLDDRGTFKKINELINQRAQEENNLISQYGQAYRGINKADKSGTGSGGKGGNTAVTASAQGSIKWYEEEIAKLNKTLQSSTDAEVRGNAQYMIAEYQAAIAKIKRQAEGSVYAMRRASFVAPGENNTNLNGDFTSKPSTSTLSTQLQIADPQAFENAKNLANIGKAVGTSWGEAARAIGSIGSALASIENPAAKVFGIIAEAVANVALGFANALANSKTGKLSVWAWIAEAAAGVGTMISTIAAIKSATSGSYANGGIIPGTNYSGDQLTANVNSGELILNKAQQGNLASQLNGGGMQALHLTATIKGEDIRLALNNNSRRRGRGEYVTSR